MRAKRVLHPGGVSWFRSRANHGGEWSLQVEPENLLIDSFHSGEGPHIHDPSDMRRRIPVSVPSAQMAWQIVELHLQHRGRIRLEHLVDELRRGGVCDDDD